MTTDNIFLDAALDYASVGFCVFPLKPRGKQPITANGSKDATRNKNIITAWWGRNPNANIGIATGNASKIWVLDIDGVEGEESLKKLEARYGALPQSLECITGGGGRHIYFDLPDSVTVKNSTSKIAPCLDVRGDGGYVVAPPSIHESGRAYAWSVDTLEKPTRAPEWLLKLVLSEPERGYNKPSAIDWAAMLQGVQEGSRNDALARLTGKLLGKRLDPEIAFYLLAAWNEARCNPPLSQDEFARTFISIATAEAKKRGLK